MRKRKSASKKVVLSCWSHNDIAADNGDQMSVGGEVTTMRKLDFSGRVKKLSCVSPAPMKAKFLSDMEGGRDLFAHQQLVLGINF